jgi:hypothetical protein
MSSPDSVQQSSRGKERGKLVVQKVKVRSCLARARAGKKISLGGKGIAGFKSFEDPLTLW